MIFNIFFKFWRIIVTVILTVLFMFCYVDLPEDVAYSFNDQGQPEKFISKQYFFYLFSGVVFFMNLLILFLKSSFAKIQYAKVLPTFSWSKAPNTLKNLLIGWCDAGLAILNSYLVFVLVGLSTTNGAKYQMLTGSYSVLTICGFILLLVWVFFLPIKILFTQPSENAG
ncbi:MAG: hypothetical protein ACRCVT_09215 [Leadbetterella sp.]